jgi:hypothetical protein
MSPAKVELSPEMTKLHQQLARVQRKIRKRGKNEKDQARRDDTHAKIVAGALALEHTKANPGSDFARKMTALLDEYARPDDRKLFPFLPARETPQPDAIDEAAE